MTDKEKLIKIKSLADRMYYIAFNMTTDASLLRKAMDDYHQFIINEYHKEEPVSEELEEASLEYWKHQLDSGEDTLRDAFKAGAKWQKEQMMAEAIDGDITFDYYGDGDKTYGCIAHNSFRLEDFGLKDRDKVKIIVIKED